MRRPYSNLRLVEGKLTSPENLAGEEILTTARKVLGTFPQKELALIMNVSESTISQWISEAKKIPLPRQFELLKQAKILCKERREIEDEIDLLMLMQFGKVTE